MRFNKKVAAALCFAAVASVGLSAFCGCQRDSFVWAKKMIDRYYLWDLPQDAAFDGSVKNYVNKYLDKYSDYYTAEEYSRIMSEWNGRRYGVGVSYNYLGSNGQLDGIFIRRVVGNSPAYFSGLERGEIVTGLVNNGAVTVTDDVQAVEKFFADMDAGDRVTLLCDRHEDGHEMVVREYTSSYCCMYTATESFNPVYRGDAAMTIDRGDDGLEYLPEGAAYIRLDQFYGAAYEQMTALAAEFNAMGCTSLVFDLRDNGGGDIQVLSAITDIFVCGRENAYDGVLYYEVKDGERTKVDLPCITAEECRIGEGVHVYVLADNGTASASEALMGALLSNGVVEYSDIYVSKYSDDYLRSAGMEDKNERTYGKGIMQTTFRNQFTGEAIKMTTAKILWPDGRTCIHDRGVGVADGCKSAYAYMPCEYGDGQLENIVKLIYGQD